MTAIKEKKQRRSYSKRDASEYNLFRKIFLFLVTKIGYMIRFKLVYRLKVYGKENIPKDNNYIVAANHLSTLDPPLVAAIMPRPVCFMAKQELFEIKFLRWWLDWLGAFAVNREHLGASTIKTAKSIKQTDWVLGLFPQGTREINGNMDNISRGFAGLAKTLKCDILPVGIVGAIKKDRKPFESHIQINIGKPIPYMEDTHEMIHIWKEKMAQLTAGEINGKD